MVVRQFKLKGFSIQSRWSQMSLPAKTDQFGFSNSAVDEVLFDWDTITWCKAPLEILPAQPARSNAVDAVAF